VSARALSVGRSREAAVVWSARGATHTLPKGRSPTSSGRGAPRATARQWVSISSSVMGSVVSCPCTTMAAESPTRHTSMPARSTYATRCERRGGGEEAHDGGGTEGEGEARREVSVGNFYV
jgi:hypothetical protein